MVPRLGGQHGLCPAPRGSLLRGCRLRRSATIWDTAARRQPALTSKWRWGRSARSPRSIWETSYDADRRHRRLPGEAMVTGHGFESAGHLLRQFCRAMGDPEIDEVTPEAVAEFLQGATALTATWMLKYRVLTACTDSPSAEGTCVSPLPTTLTKLPPQQTPYVYSTEELRRLLEATSILRIGHKPQVPAMYRTLLLLLYESNMRIGEALRLALQDVDLTEQVITIRDTKFFKTRLVPIGPKLNRELVAHVERRRLLPLPHGEASPLFTTRDGRPWQYTGVISWFQHIRRAAGISCPVGEPRPPRLHDIRHYLPFRIMSGNSEASTDLGRNIVSCRV
jgi:integrase/recombinase XerD